MPFRFGVPARAQSILKFESATRVESEFPVTSWLLLGVSTRSFAPVCAVIGGPAAEAVNARAPAATPVARAKVVLLVERIEIPPEVGLNRSFDACATQTGAASRDYSSP